MLYLVGDEPVGSFISSKDPSCSCGCGSHGRHESGTACFRVIRCFAWLALANVIASGAILGIAMFIQVCLPDVHPSDDGAVPRILFLLLGFSWLHPWRRSGVRRSRRDIDLLQFVGRPLLRLGHWHDGPSVLHASVTFVKDNILASSPVHAEP